MKNQILKNFPFPEIRTKQQEVIEVIEKNWDKYKYFVLECPTGFGKSPVSYAIGTSVYQSFLITATKQLQDQYSKDFEEPTLVNLKGKSNYICNVNPEFTVENAPCNIDKSLFYNCQKHKVCSFYNQKNKALFSKMLVLSSALFLTMTNPIGQFKPRDVLIVDECHLLENQVTQWATLFISPSKILKDYDIELPPYEAKSGYINNASWLNHVWQIIVNKKEELFEDVRDLLNGKDVDQLSEEELEELLSSNNLYYKVDKIYRKFQIFFQSTNKENWLCEPQEDGVVLTPIDISDLFNRYIKKMAIKKIFFMSATILDMVGFAKNLGLKKEETALVRIESDFPPENSPIIYKPCGSMSYQNIDKTIPSIIESVKEILKNHPNEKAIIHSGNYKIAQAIYDALNDKRLIIKKNGETNESIIKKHTNSKEPTVLISPSLTTGVDLKDDLSRFQIIVKLPFMSLSDARVKKKIEKHEDWYICEMFRTLVQAAGRSTRSKDDWSVTYVLDSSFYSWVLKYRKWFSKNFLNRIKWK